MKPNSELRAEPSVPRAITSSAPSNLPSSARGGDALPQTAEAHKKPAARNAGALLGGLKRRVMGHQRTAAVAASVVSRPTSDARLAAVRGSGLARLRQGLPQDAGVELRFRRGEGPGASAEVLHVPLHDVGFGAGLIAHAPQPGQGDVGSPVRQAAVHQAEQVKAHFQALQQGNWSPGPMDGKYEIAMLPAIVAAENARTPNLNLTLLSPNEDFASWLKAKRPANARVIFPMPGNEAHYVAADVRRNGGKTSVIVIEPLSLKDATQDLQDSTRQKYERQSLPLLKKTLKSDVTLSVLAVDTQKSTNDCGIFALSAASKLADNAPMLDALHEQNLGKKPIKTALGQDAELLAGKGKVRVLDGKGVLPPAFVKHSQSRTTLKDWLKANPAAHGYASVNKAEQSLMERFDSHVTTRYDKPVHTRFMQDNLPEMEVQIKNLTFSASIEKKRLVYLDRAIAYLKQAPEAECGRLLAGMSRFDGDAPGADNLHLDDRDWGPHPDSL